MIPTIICFASFNGSLINKCLQIIIHKDHAIGFAGCDHVIDLFDLHFTDHISDGCINDEDLVGADDTRAVFFRYELLANDPA